MPQNKQFEPTVIRRHVRAASAPLHYALAARWTRGRAAAQLRRSAALNHLRKLNPSKIMRRTDTGQVGTMAEVFALRLLKGRGFGARNLNDERYNYPLYDLIVDRDGSEVFVSVKCARANRQLRLGSPSQLKQISDKCVVMAFLPAVKGEEIRFLDGGYELLILPGAVARDEALAAHYHYAKTHPGNANHTVMVKDKVDRTPDTHSGAVFHSWRTRFLNAWDVFNEVL